MMQDAPLVIEPGGTDRQYWRDLWRYRELFHMLAMRDVAVRYKQTALGAAWAILQPLATMLVFVVIFGRIAGLPSEGSAPYPLLVISGLLAWQLFATALNGAAMSVVNSANLIGKIYFPRIIVPTGAVVLALVDFVFSLVVLGGLLVWYQYPLTWRALALPLFVLMAVLAALGPGLWIAALNVKYRDFRFVVPFLIQMGLYVSPVGFSASLVPPQWQLLYALNPMTGVIYGFRWALLGGEARIDAGAMAVSCAAIAAMLWIGVREFRRAEKQFADLI